MDFTTPYYRIDKSALLANVQRAVRLRELSNARILLALKCFASWPVFDLMRDYLDGTTSSSLFELKLGKEKFGGETHAYSVAWADHEIHEAASHADKIIFNSISQLQRFAAVTAHLPRGLRLNPGVSVSGFDLADPARPYSRLGESDPERIAAVIDQLDGLMVHNNCDNRDFSRLCELLDVLEARYGHLLQHVSWVSLGGGIHFTAADYPLEALALRLRQLADKYDVQIYLEPGEALAQGAATLEVTVLDVGFNGKPLAIVDSSTEAHMLDLLIYRLPARIEPNAGDYSYMICGKTCLAGDVFGEYRFPAALEVGSRLSIEDAAAYTMVKKNWFNGVRMPSIVIRELDGREYLQREFDYQDYLASLG